MDFRLTIRERNLGPTSLSNRVLSHRFRSVTVRHCLEIPGSDGQPCFEQLLSSKVMVRNKTYREWDDSLESQSFTCL